MVAAYLAQARMQEVASMDKEKEAPTGDGQLDQAKSAVKNRSSLSGAARKRMH